MTRPAERREPRTSPKLVRASWQGDIARNWGQEFWVRLELHRFVAAGASNVCNSNLTPIPNSNVVCGYADAATGCANTTTWPPGSRTPISSIP